MFRKTRKMKINQELRGEVLFRSLPEGEYCINGRQVQICTTSGGNKCVDVAPYHPFAFSWFDDRAKRWYGEERVKDAIGMDIEDITERHVKRHGTEGVSLLSRLPDGEYYICGKRTAVSTNGRDIIFASVPFTVDAYSYVRPNGDWVNKRSFKKYFGMHPKNIKSHHINKTPTQCCPCSYCNDVTVRFGEPEGASLLKRITKPGMTIKIMDVLCNVDKTRDNMLRISPVRDYNACVLIWGDFLKTKGFIEFECKIGMNPNWIKRSDIEILFDPE